MIYLFLVGLLLFGLSIYLVVKNKFTPITPFFFSIGFIMIFVSIALSFGETYSIEKTTPKYVNIVEGKDAIYVETDLGDFKLTQLSSRSILKGKNFKVVRPKNYWGIYKTQSKYIDWEN